MNDKAIDHYNLTLHEIEKGMPLNQVREILKHYESLEEYEECQGIFMALEVVSFNVLTELVRNNKNKIKVKWKKQ
jgi:hypothetical protein